MRRQRFTDEQITGILAEQQGGMKMADLCRKHGISPSTFGNWKTRFADGKRTPDERPQLPPARSSAAIRHQAQRASRKRRSSASRPGDHNGPNRSPLSIESISLSNGGGPPPRYAEPAYQVYAACSFRKIR